MFRLFCASAVERVAHTLHLALFCGAGDAEGQRILKKRFPVYDAKVNRSVYQPGQESLDLTLYSLSRLWNRNIGTDRANHPLL